jgi:hypothetical protein
MAQRFIHIASQGRTPTERAACISKALIANRQWMPDIRGPHQGKPRRMWMSHVYRMHSQYLSQSGRRCSDIRSGGPRHCGGIVHIHILMSPDSDDNPGWDNSIKCQNPDAEDRFHYESPSHPSVVTVEIQYAL